MKASRPLLAGMFMTCALQCVPQQRSMTEPSSDVQDLTVEPSGSGPPDAGTHAHAVKKRGILSFLHKGINKVVTALSPEKAASDTATPSVAAPTSTSKRLFSGKLAPSIRHCNSECYVNTFL
jgi:hypothetical protein